MARIDKSERVAFAGRGEADAEQLEDLDTARLVTGIQAGEREGFATLYARYFDRVYGYLRAILKDRHEAEDLTQEVFIKVLEGIGSYQRRRQPFRAWLFVVTRNCARDHLRASARIDVMDPAELSDYQERTAANGDADETIEAQLRALSWLNSQDLSVLVERLPQTQRQVLAMRFLLGMPAHEIAEVLGTSPNHVSVLQYRALGFLRERLAALGSVPETRDRSRMARVPRKSTVLRSRRFSLDK